MEGQLNDHEKSLESVKEVTKIISLDRRKVSSAGRAFTCNSLHALYIVGGVVASWLVCLSPDRAVRVRALAGDIVLCSWAGHFTLTVPLSTQVYKWVPANLMLGVTLRWTSIPSRGE